MKLWLTWLVGLSALGLAGCGSAGSPTPVRAVHRHGLMSILQSDAALNSNPQAVIAAAKALGVQALRVNVLWSATVRDPTTPHPPAGFVASDPASPDYDFAALDSIDRFAAAAHLRLYLTLTSPVPLWAATPYHGPRYLAQHWRPSAADFGAWVTAVGRRYSGAYTPPGASGPLPRVNMWSLWNEPNYGPNLAPQALPGTVHGARVIIDTSAPQYRRLLAAGWRALAATGHRPGSDTILIGETAPHGELNPGLDNMTPPLQFLRDLYCVSDTYQPLSGAAAQAEDCPSVGAAGFVSANPALFDASGWADHPYPAGHPPNELTGEPSQTEGYADFARLDNLETALQRAAAAWGTHARLSIYDTEFGYWTRPPANASVPNAVSLGTAARDINWAEYLTWKNPEVASYDQYLLTDPPVGSSSHFVTGIEFADGTPKPQLYDAYRLALWLPRTTGRSLEVWGCARPVQSGSGAHTVAVQYAAGGSAFHTVARATLHPASSGCYFDIHVTFPGAGAVRLAYASAAGPVISRVQTISGP
ncbi:MAG TPA: hypothetical protein VFN48_09380 [Solirubrobacteraceae bacterium]|nr:hypothetical protein [Solirubrobacteraceae bacterium]